MKLTIELNDTQAAGWQVQLDRVNKQRADADLPEWALEDYFQNNAAQDGDRLNMQERKRTALAEVLKGLNMSEPQLRRILALGGKAE